MKNEAVVTEESVKAPRPNISDKELDRDLVNLHLPENDMIATDEECAALYRPGVYEQMKKAATE